MNIEKHYYVLAAENIALKAERSELSRRVAELERENALLHRRIRTLRDVRDMEQRWADEEVQGVV